MSKHSGEAESYEDALARLQLALVRCQIAAIAEGRRTLVIFEGRDGAGKDGVIARITAHLSTRATRVVSLPKHSPATGSAPNGGFSAMSPTCRARANS